jgi:hypothetical protein
VTDAKTADGTYQGLSVMGKFRASVMGKGECDGATRHAQLSQAGGLGQATKLQGGPETNPVTGAKTASGVHKGSV